MDGRSIPHEPDVPERQPRPRVAEGGSGRVAKTSAWASEGDSMAGIPNAVRRDHRRLQAVLAQRELDELPVSWMSNAQNDRAREDGTVVFPPPRMQSGPGLDYLGRPTRRRRGGRS